MTSTAPLAELPLRSHRPTGGGRSPRAAGDDAKVLRWTRYIGCELREMVRNCCMQHLLILLASARTGDGRRAVHLHMSILSRQGRLELTPDRVCPGPVSIGFERGSNSHRSIISGCHRLLHVVFLNGCTLGQAGVSEFWFERAPSQKVCTSTGCY